MSTPKEYERILNISLPKNQSAFLLGPRKTGKTRYLKTRFKDSKYFDLLHTDIYLDFLNSPRLLREELLAIEKTYDTRLPVIIDEIQLVPLLLNEVHWLIENTNFSFILCGSSARKLKKHQANMLGGRAWRYDLFPLTCNEIPEFNLLTALNNGLIPSHYNSANPRQSLRSYISTYLKEEIVAEGLDRNLPNFSRFLDAVSFQVGELVNFTKIASDCGVKARVVKEYYQILIDTFLGYYLPPYTNSRGRDSIISTPKFYLFDTGVAVTLCKERITRLKGAFAGKIFENFILHELVAWNSYNEKECEFSFWQTKSGLEVDFIVNKGDAAIEVKISTAISRSDLSGLVAFADENPTEKLYLVCNETRKRVISLTNSSRQITIYPWQSFLHDLWNKNII
jgi:predicted AAA+ superfamily ATPase